VEIINYLGDKLSEHINITPPASRGLLKLAIKDELGPFKPLESINFNDLKNVINNSLQKRLQKLNIQNFQNVIKNLLEELTKNQSLITMSLI
jgi:hypothetical protein